MEDQLLIVKNLRKFFGHARIRIYALNGVSFGIERGETLGIVGESGCGKTTLARCILRLIEPTSGDILFEGKDLLKATKKRMREFRRDMQIVFQDPYSSLNPRMTVKNIVAEPLEALGLCPKNEATKRVADMILRIGLTEQHMHQLPHEFSGGQRQRICIARALISNPKFVLLDEPTSALDVSVGARILNLLKDMQKASKLTCLFISHDLAVVRYMSDHIGVMYLGKMVEIARRHDLFKNQLHPYSQALISAVPRPDPKAKRSVILPGSPPSPSNLPPGCSFHPRCPYAFSLCTKEEPKLMEVESGRFVACHLVQKR